MTATALAAILRADAETLLRESERIDADDAHDVIARRYGFGSWPELVAFLPYLGELTDRHTLIFRREMPVDRQRVWTAVSDPAELSQWFMETTMKARVGGRFSFKDGWDGVVSALEPGSAITFAADHGGRTRFEIEAIENGTHFRLVDRMAPGATAPDGGAGDIGVRQPGGPGTHWVGIVVGWHDFVDSLLDHLGTPAPTLGEREMTLLYDRLLTAQFGVS